ncbi:MAG: hypothetical protein GTO47_19165 [Gammaproteobacteria bacterium]|nr:hypothetical protein [Gammaproteobacteria bacterium]
MTEQTVDPDVEAAWARARPISGCDPEVYRIAPDVIQSLIRRDRYNVCGEFGWRIEYGRPVAFREITTESAIRALQRDGSGTGLRLTRSGMVDQLRQ